MHRIFVGNLDPRTTQDGILSVLSNAGIRAVGVTFKDHLGIAFIDFECQNHADRAVDALSRIHNLKVEPTVPKKQDWLSCRTIVHVSGLRATTFSDDSIEFKQLLNEFGTILDIKQYSVRPPYVVTETQSVEVTYATREEAYSAAEKLNLLVFKQQPLQACVMQPQHANVNGQVGVSGGGNRGGNRSYQNRANARSAPLNAAPSASHAVQQQTAMTSHDMTDIPVRMVVDFRYVGAIIGQGGANIRDITKDCKARCCVGTQRFSRTDQASGIPVQEKVIDIYGQLPENCSKAAVRILEVINREKARTSEGGGDASGAPTESEMKLLAHNNLVGRLIGKNGATVKKIMEDTQCSVAISNMSDMSLPASMDQRTITIRGQSVENISKAEQLISQKLRQCYAFDLQQQPQHIPANMLQQRGGFGGGGLMNTASIMNVLPHVPGVYGGHVDPATAHMYHMGGGQHLQSMTGAYGIPTGQTMLSNGQGTVMSYSHHGYAPTPAALIGGGAAAMTPQGAHILHPTGIPASIMTAPTNVTEIVNVFVPNSMVGALIGTKGAQIRNMMRTTGAHVRIEPTAGVSSNNSEPPKRNDSGDENAAGEANNDKNGTAKKTSLTKSTDGATGQQRPTAALSPSSTGSGGNKGQQSNAQWEHPTADERQVTVTGNCEQQYRAQLWIYQRVAEFCQHSFLDDTRLCVEIRVPSKLVGRIIGKGGSNVRELQRTTLAIVKVSDDGVQSATDAGKDETNEASDATKKDSSGGDVGTDADDKKEQHANKSASTTPPAVDAAAVPAIVTIPMTLVRIVGTFQASQAAQAKIRQLVYHHQHQIVPPTSQQQSGGGGGTTSFASFGGGGHHHMGGGVVSNIVSHVGGGNATMMPTPLVPSIQQQQQHHQHMPQQQQYLHHNQPPQTGMHQYGGHQQQQHANMRSQRQQRTTPPQQHTRSTIAH